MFVTARKMIEMTGFSGAIIRKRCVNAPKRQGKYGMEYSLPDALRDLYQPGGEQPAGPIDLEYERSRFERARATRAEIDLEKLRATLVEVAPALRVWLVATGAVRSKLLALPAAVALEVCNLGDPNKVEKLLELRIHEALREITRMSPEGFLPDDGEGLGQDEPLDPGEGQSEA